MYNYYMIQFVFFSILVSLLYLFLVVVILGIILIILMLLSLIKVRYKGFQTLINIKLKLARGLICFLSLIYLRTILKVFIYEEYLNMLI